jgi:hypothetical protein
MYIHRKIIINDSTLGGLAFRKVQGVEMRGCTLKLVENLNRRIK